MGLKEPGLRGSLRNTGSVVPAFFDVTITNTNSPVQEGDILTVDYSADNTGDAQDMQDIRLEIDSVQEDVDLDVMLSGGASTTGTLEWDTTGEDEAEYTATVLSDDDSDSVMVEIGSDIPDSVLDQLDHRYKHDEGSGDILTDDIGDANFDIDGASWVSSAGEGGVHLDYDGIDDYSLNEDGSTVWNFDTFVWITWFNPDELGDNGYLIAGDEIDGGGFDYVLGVGGLNLPTDEFGLFMDDADAGGNFTLTTSDVVADEWQFGAAVVDASANQAEVYYAKRSDSTISSIGTNNYDGSLDSGVRAIAFGDDWIENDGLPRGEAFNGQMDETFSAMGGTLSETDIQEIFDGTKGNYS